MSFLRSRPPVQSNRHQQRRALGAGASLSNGPSIKRKIEKPTPQVVPENHTDYKLVSTSRDVLHHVMRFHSTKDVDPTAFTAPVKLHRKRNESSSNYRGYYNNKYSNQNNAGNKDGGGDDKKDGAGDKKDGANGAPAAPTTGADMSLIAPFGGGNRNAKMLFKRRTRQIFFGDDKERQKKEIESAPWVVEDYDSKNSWTGQLEGGQHANYVLFVFSDDGFKVVPADKWYTFSPKIPYTTLTSEEAEEQYQKSQKQNNSIRWLMKSKNKAKAEDGEEGMEEDIETDHLMTVDHEDDAGYDEDEAKERKKKRGKHGDVDEMDFDEVWQDDEEMPAEMPGFEDDAKDDPRSKHGPAMDSDEDEDEEDSKGRLTETGKAVKKALLKLEKNKVYASDDDKDPYASDKDSSDSDLDEIDKEKEKKEDETNSLLQDTSKSKSKGKANAKGAPLIAKKQSATKTPNKPVSAKAAKAIKVPLPNPRNASASAQSNGKAVASTSKAGPSSSASSQGSKQTSGASSSSSPSNATARASSPDRKRKKMGDSSETNDDSSRKYARVSEADTGSAGDDSMLITEEEVIAILKSRPEVTTRDLIVDLKKKLRREPRNKNLLADIVKKVATAQNNILVLKKGL
ncbi:hypothetical protein BGZ80_006015 [Entomortierella chlamydospora]|uniref:Transcription initiation factor IIF subunit alpha n=1 Tax=Entomortierella chlamydospora TaxID=101097 RepID=A0A9P6MZ44_9FUNG|nr:hypothetical protein BGZ79_003989 [Entomortierella chlamydospora]KAG0019299.1 hypothetical protein BGZ80_006015 [Entomortierella chlamydospora]